MHQSSTKRCHWNLTAFFAVLFTFAFISIPLSATAADPSQGHSAFEAKIWNKIKNSTSPEPFQTYLELYPNGQYAAQARARIKALTPGTEKSGVETYTRHPRAIEPPKEEVVKFAESKDCPDCPVMVSLPAGSFTMGTNSGVMTERPARSVTLRSPFAISKFEITVEQWDQCAKERGCKARSSKVGSDPRLPIHDVSWDDAQSYVKWLSQKTKQRYRLPTEAEWEYAARAGTNSQFWWGSSMQSNKANCKDCGGGGNIESPEQVGVTDPNPFGLHDMNGNVWEWVADCWYKNFTGAPRDGSARTKHDCRSHVIRGGSWRDKTDYVNSTSRFHYDGNVRYLLNGFRIAKSLY